MIKIDTPRFGALEIGDNEVISFQEGLWGFPELQRYCLVDSGDDTLILWLQSLDDVKIAFPVLEPKIFKMDYVVKLSTQELRQLKLDNINQSIVFNIITIPQDITQMSANLKAPIVVNLREHTAKQVVLQENEYTLKYPMFTALKAQLIRIKEVNEAHSANTQIRPAASLPINLRSMVPSVQVKSL